MKRTPILLKRYDDVLQYNINNNLKINYMKDIILKIELKLNLKFKPKTINKIIVFMVQLIILGVIK